MARESGRGRAEAAVDPTLAQKKRARHRLVGAIALCLLAALLIPLILEAEPRQKPREIPLEIAARSPPAAKAGGANGDASAAPDAASRPGAEARSTVKPVDLGSAGHGTAEAPAAPTAPAVAAVTPPGRERPATDKSAEKHAAERRAAEKTASDRASGQPTRMAEARTPEGRSDPRTTPPRPDGDPLAVIINRTDPAPDAAARKEAARRYLVQIGAYSSIEGARAVSSRVFSSGLRPYQETIRTDKGEWIRVRVGPFENREAAEQALRNLKAAGVSAALMTL